MMSENKFWLLIWTIVAASVVVITFVFAGLSYHTTVKFVEGGYCSGSGQGTWVKCSK